MINKVKHLFMCLPVIHVSSLETCLFRSSFHFFIDVESVSCSVVSDSATLWTVARQAPMYKEFSRQKYYSESSFPSPGALLNPGIEPGSPALQADTLTSEPFFFFFEIK